MFKKLSEAIGKNDYYKLWFKDAWPYITGAVLLAVFQIATFAKTGNPWGVSAVFANWGAWIFQAFGGSVDKWYYFATEGSLTVLDRGVLVDPGSIRNVGLILGALFSTLIASGFKIKKLKSVKQLVAATLGGLLMGYGARLASGCNIGALFSGIGVMSLSGWVFGVFLFVGAIIGSKLLVKFFM